MARLVHAWSALRARLRGERGSVTLETAVVFPVVLMLFFGIIQGALYYHAVDVARHAAQSAVTVASARDGSAGAGQAAAESFLAQVGTGTLSGVSIAVDRTAETATATVKGNAVSLVPALELPVISQAAAGVVERWVPAGG